MLMSPEPFGVGAFQFEAHARPRPIWSELAVCRPKGPLKEHLLDADMVVKILDVPGARSDAAQVSVNGWRRVSR